MVRFQGLVVGYLRIKRVEEEEDMDKDKKRKEKEERGEKRVLVKVFEFLAISQLHVPKPLPASTVRLLNPLSVTSHLPSFFPSFHIIL